MCGPDQKDKGTPMYRVVPTSGTSDADRIAELRARLRSKLDVQEAASALRSAMWLLARNLRDAAGLYLAAYCGEVAGIASVYADRGVTISAWRPEQGRAWPGWER
jgi:hypothetical protein